MAGKPHFVNAILRHRPWLNMRILIAKSLIDPCSRFVPLRVVNLSTSQSLYAADMRSDL